MLPVLLIRSHALAQVPRPESACVQGANRVGGQEGAGRELHGNQRLS